MAIATSPEAKQELDSLGMYGRKVVWNLDLG
jgi:hypothetical protein